MGFPVDWARFWVNSGVQKKWRLIFRGGGESRFAPPPFGRSLSGGFKALAPDVPWRLFFVKTTIFGSFKAPRQRSPEGGGGKPRFAPPLRNISLHFFWTPEFTQKRAQSTGNHIARLWEKNLDQNDILEKKLEHYFFSKKKVGHLKIIENINQIPLKIP